MENQQTNPAKLKHLDRQMNTALNNGDIEQAKKFYEEGNKLVKQLTKLTQDELKQLIKALPPLVQQVIYAAIPERNKKYPPETN